MSRLRKRRLRKRHEEHEKGSRTPLRKGRHGQPENLEPSGTVASWRRGERMRKRAGRHRGEKGARTMEGLEKVTKRQRGCEYASWVGPLRWSR